MTRIESIESEVERLSPQELAVFRQWFMEYDAETWDRQIEADAQAGRLDALARRAIQSHQRGMSRKL